MSTLIIYLFSFRFGSVRLCEEVLGNCLNCLNVHLIAYDLKFCLIATSHPSSFAVTRVARVCSVALGFSKPRVLNSLIDSSHSLSYFNNFCYYLHYFNLPWNGF